MRLRESERGLYTLIAVTALLVIYVVAFVVSNSTRVEVSFVIFSGRAPLIVIMLLCVVIGVAIGVIGGRVGIHLRDRRTTTSTSTAAASTPPDQRPTDPID
jgi:uncharacterized integral membrane protein